MADVPKDHRLEDIMLYKQGALTDTERTELEEHIRSCADCQANLEMVNRLLPALQQALVPDRQSPEELLAWAKARMREEPAKPAGFFTKTRVALLGFGFAGATASLIALQPVLQPFESGLMARLRGGSGSSNDVLAAPRPPPKKPDAGMDAGKDGEEKGGKGP